MVRQYDLGLRLVVLDVDVMVQWGQCGVVVESSKASRSMCLLLLLPLEHPGLWMHADKYAIAFACCLVVLLAIFFA